MNNESDFVLNQILKLGVNVNNILKHLIDIPYSGQEQHRLIESFGADFETENEKIRLRSIHSALYDNDEKLIKYLLIRGCKADALAVIIALSKSSEENVLRIYKTAFQQNPHVIFEEVQDQPLWLALISPKYHDVFENLDQTKLMRLGCSFLARAEYSNQELKDYFRRVGIDINALLIHIISQSGIERIELLKKIISLGPDINCKLTGEDFPIVMALRNTDIQTAAFLIAQGANLTVKDVVGRSIMDIIGEFGLAEILPIISEKKSFSKEEYCELLIKFCEFKNPKFIESFLSDLGLEKDSDFRFLVLRNANIDMLKFLLASPAFLRFFCEDPDFHPIDYGIYNRKGVEWLRLFTDDLAPTSPLAIKLYYYRTGPNDDTVMHTAVNAGDVDVMQHLLEERKMGATLFVTNKNFHRPWDILNNRKYLYATSENDIERLRTFVDYVNTWVFDNINPEVVSRVYSATTKKMFELLMRKGRCA